MGGDEQLDLFAREGEEMRMQTFGHAVGEDMVMEEECRVQQPAGGI